ncbi:molybdate ABC transporter substrate-binding protein [uncultured Pseudoteredinibacter sp.]|uniref:molybdate ABC transporter substrate-binding protein n=1 Tax=uncultured Pseudoteredinibacter sp. TaxID=1641701 RepID=UPI0026343DC2|nr:molybdate ABC transporter substrate-binding protein [uncultured Pseudoteredinibacter sp.]
MVKLILALFSIFLFINSISKTYSATLTVAVASNFAHSARQIGQEFSKESGHKVRFVLGSSGKIAAQIRHGAPFDIFLSADQLRPKQLVAEGFALADSQFSYAEGALVLWSSHAEHRNKKLSVEFLKREAGKIALANPKLAPYGKAASSVLAKLANEAKPNKAGNIVQIQGENIAQAYHFTQAGQVDAGFIAKSQWLSLQTEDRNNAWQVPKQLHPAILQDAVLLKRSSNKLSATAFWRFLQTPKAQQIIESHGYSIPYSDSKDFDRNLDLKE